ncbi:MAG: hypothetical protein AAF513_12225 [Pseudomonadota bacterium]
MKLLIVSAIVLVLLLIFLRRRTGPNAEIGRAPLQPRQTRQEAEELLGLSPPYDDADVIAAHRRLMQKVHPDKGGTVALAQALNEAKRVLLQR